MFANRLARWVSVFFDSSVLSLFVFPAIGWHVAGFAGVGWSLAALLMLTGVPLTYLAIGRKRGWVSDWELTQRAERPRFILVSLGSDVLALAVLGWGGAPTTVWALALVYASLGITMFIISNFWKISLHMVTVSGFSVLLSTVFGAGITWVWLSLPLVAWARLHRKKHNGAQLVMGALLGALITATVLKLAGIG